METPCIQGHYRKYLIRGVTSRYLQSGDQLEPISTNSTCIGRVSLLYMNMFKMLELWCPWKAPVKIHAPIWFISYYYKSLVLFTIPVFALVCRFLSLLCIHPVCGQLHSSVIFCFFLSCVFTMEVVGISVEVKVCFFGKRPWHKWIYMYWDVDMMASVSAKRYSQDDRLIPR